jgi:hypothetical protein
MTVSKRGKIASLMRQVKDLQYQISDLVQEEFTPGTCVSWSHWNKYGEYEQEGEVIAVYGTGTRARLRVRNLRTGRIVDLEPGQVIK